MMTTKRNGSPSRASLKKSCASHWNRSLYKAGDSWTEVFQPQSADELAVHKRKVSEVDDWIKHYTRRVSSHTSTHSSENSSILLLIGPTGSGKTITLQVLAKDNGLQLSEWVHPLTVNYGGGLENVRAAQKFDDLASESVVKSFQDFLFEGSRYHSLFEPKSPRALVVEDIPWLFLKRVDEFHDCLRNYRKFGRCPLIVLLCETSASREFKLFPPDLKHELKISTIKFNLVAIGLLDKAIKDILRKAAQIFGGTFCRPPEGEIDSIVQTSQGDLRLAVNLLQLACMGASRITKFDVLQNPNNGKKRKGCKNTETRKSIKDTALYIFHSLGKVLYAKRDEIASCDNLPPHLKHLGRRPLKETPEEIFERTCVSQDFFLKMLHSNASNFYESIESAAGCLEWFSLGDEFRSFWDPSGIMNDLSISVTLRGLMFLLGTSDRKQAFHAFRKPRVDHHQIETKLENIRRLPVQQGLAIESLVRDLLPYITVIRPKNLSSQCWAVIVDSVFNLKKTKSFFSSRLNEDDILDKDVSDDSDDARNANQLCQWPGGLDHDISITSGCHEESDIVIEEVDSN